jgi:hypothetical protein
MTPGNYIFSLDYIDIGILEDICLAISFDYLIIPSLTIGYDYYSGLIQNRDRQKLHCLSRKSNNLTKKIAIWIQFRDNPKNNYIYSLSWCHFIRSSKYYLDEDGSNWLKYSYRLDKHAYYKITGMIKRHYLNSLFLKKRDKLDNLLLKFKVDKSLVKSSFKLGLIYENRGSYRRWTNIEKKSPNWARKRANFKSLNYRKLELKLINRVTKVCEYKYSLLHELRTSRLICEYPGCTKQWFYPKISCFVQRYFV